MVTSKALKWHLKEVRFDYILFSENYAAFLQLKYELMSLHGKRRKPDHSNYKIVDGLICDRRKWKWGGDKGIS